MPKINHIGRNNPFYNKKHTEEAKKKIGLYHKNKKLSKIHKEKISNSLKNHKTSKETREKISKIHSGKRNYNWNGGLSNWYIFKLSMNSLLKNKRDLTKCELCGHIGKIGRYKGNLVIHHIDKNRKNNHFSNLKISCKSCHTKQHPKIYLQCRTTDLTALAKSI